jgi:hypothetical protein
LKLSLGQSVTLLARGSAVPLLREHGITVTGVCGDHRIGPNRLRLCDAGEPDAQDIACDVLSMGQGRGIATAGNDVVASLVRARETGVAVPARA